MTGKGASREASAPSGLRVMHGAAFLGFAAVGLVAAWPEVAHLLGSQSQPLHFGDPPVATALLGALGVLVGLVVMVLAWARGAAVPLWASLCILGGDALAIVAMQRQLPQGRNSFAANVKLIEAGKSVQGQFVRRLQAEGQVPTETAPWAEAFAAQPSVVRSRGYSPVPYRVERVKTEGALPEVLVPGTFVLFVSPDGAMFQLTAIGFGTDGRPWQLKDPQGEPVRFSGVFNPDLGLVPDPLPGSANRP